MSRCTTLAKKQSIDIPIDVILLSAGQGRRMKSFGSKSLFNIGGKSLIEHQIDTIQSKIPKAEIITVLGYELEKIEKYIPNNVRIVENNQYESSTSVKSAMIGLMASAKDNVLIINGDIYFNDKIFDLICGETSTLIDNKNQISQDKAGVILNNGYVSHFSFGLDTTWGQMVYLHSGDIDIFYKICKETKQEVIMIEVLNMMLAKGCNFKAINPNNINLVEIDGIKDLERIK